MFKNEVKKEYQTIYNITSKIDNELVNIKIAIHNLEKLGVNTHDLEKQLDNVGIEIYKFKNENMEKFSKNKKLNGVLNDILDSLNDLGLEEVKRYYKEFGAYKDYNIVEYANLLIYYDDIRELYKSNGYKSIDKMSDSKIWETYKRQVGYVARYMVRV